MSRSPFTSSACRSISAAAGAASTWARPRSASPDSASGSPRSATRIVDKGDLPAPIPETQELRDEQQEVHPRDRPGLSAGVPDRPGVARRGRDADRARRRSQPRAPDRWRRRPSGPGARSQLPIGLLWVDAHGDMNTPATSLSGNVHGMPLAALLGPEPAELVGDRRVFAEGAAGAHRARRHPESRRARKDRGPRRGRSRLHDEGHRSPGHRVDRRAGGGSRRQRHRGRPRVVRHGRLRSARSRPASARR